MNSEPRVIAQDEAALYFATPTMIGEHLGKIEDEQAKMEAMNADVLEMISLAQDDPSQHQYFMRTDKKKIIKSEQEYMRCVTSGIGVKVVSHGHAVALEAKFAKDEKKRKVTRKTQKASRKRNR